MRRPHQLRAPRSEERRVGKEWRSLCDWSSDVCSSDLSYAQKDPLIEYKTEAYDMFVELMANIKNEVLNNLFRSTSNLQAFENFLATLPQFLMREHAPTAPTAGAEIGRASCRERVEITV